MGSNPEKSQHRSGTQGNDSILQRKYQQTLWFQPCFQSGARFRPPTACSPFWVVLNTLFGPFEVTLLFSVMFHVEIADTLGSWRLVLLLFCGGGVAESKEKADLLFLCLAIPKSVVPWHKGNCAIHLRPVPFHLRTSGKVTEADSSEMDLFWGCDVQMVHQRKADQFQCCCLCLLNHFETNP